jgi:hypothetical protein
VIFKRKTENKASCLSEKKEEEEEEGGEKGERGEEEKEETEKEEPMCKAFALYVLLEHVGPWLPSYEDI